MQYTQAVGMAEASLYFERFPHALAQAQKAPLGQDVRHQPDEIVYVSGGDGSTSEGEFFEALNAACLRKLPLLFLIEDNGWAISVPGEIPDGGRKHFEAGGELSGPSRGGMRRQRSARQLCGTAARRRILPGAERPGAGACARHAALFPFAFRRRKTLQDGRIARAGGAPRPDSQIWSCSWCAKAFSMRRNWRRSKQKSIAKCARPPTRRSWRSRPPGNPFLST